MVGKNWNSKTKQWSNLVRPETKQKAKMANQMKASGKSVKEIAKILKLSESRIREYLRK